MSTRTIKVPAVLYRTGTSAAKDDGTMELSISSDTPYERYDWLNDERYLEVLDHSPTGMDCERLKAGAALLFNHDRNIQLGTLSDPVMRDGKCYVTAKLSAAEDVASYRTRIAEGILKDTSVGYAITDSGTQIGTRDGLPIYKFRWAPHEASMVTIPADITVGVGRGHENEGKGELREILVDNLLHAPKQSTHTKNMSEPITTPSAPAKPEIDLVKERQDAVTQHKAKCKKIDDFTSALKNQQWREAATAIAIKHKDGNADFDEFRAEALNAFEGVTKVTADAGIGMEQKDAKRFSLLSAVRSIISRGKLDGFEAEVCGAAQAKMRRTLPNERTFVLPEEVSAYQRELSLRDLLSRAGNVTTATAGGFLVQTQYGSMIELLRNQMALGRAGITILDGLVGDFVMPVQTGGCTAYWVSETGAITDSQATFAQKSLVPHRVGASYPFTMQLLAQSSTAIDTFVRNELDTVIALKKDAAGLLGSGVSGEPLGVANTTGINATVTYGGAATWPDVVEHETGIAVDNADIGSMGFILDAASVGKWKTILKDSVAGAGYLLTDGMTANGYNVTRSNQISAAHQSFFGVWSQLIHAIWAGREVTVDSVTLAKSGQHQIIINELCDFLVRQPLAFNVSTDSAAQ